jgi:hypothetical protein
MSTGIRTVTKNENDIGALKEKIRKGNRSVAGWFAFGVVNTIGIAGLTTMSMHNIHVDVPTATALGVEGASVALSAVMLTVRSVESLFSYAELDNMEKLKKLKR